MQIILVQAEIEQALKDYVNKTMKVADGVGIDIELTATRGAEGFKAFINIQPIAGFIPPKLLIQERPPFNSETSTARSPEPEYVDKTELSPLVQEIVESDQLPAGEGITEFREAQGEAPAPQGNTRSLFKGLGKPKNVAS